MSTDIFDQITAQPDPGEPAEFAPSTSEDSAELAASITPKAIKQSCQELLKFGLLEMEHKPRLYQTALNQQDEIRRLLEPFDLDLRIDHIRGLAFLTVAEDIAGEGDDDEWSHPLVRRQRLTLEQSLLVAILRKRFLNHEQEAGTGASGAQVFVDELLPELRVYLPELGSDQKEQERLRNLLEKLKGHGLVSAVDDQDRVTIRPIIAHLANPKSLQALLEQYLRLAKGWDADSCPSPARGGERSEGTIEGFGL